MAPDKGIINDGMTDNSLILAKHGT